MSVLTGRTQVETEVLTTCLTFSGGAAISIWVDVVGMSLLIAQC